MARTLVVALVDREDDRPVGLPQFARDRLVARDQTFAPIHHQDKEIGPDNGALPLADDELVQRVLARAVQAAGIRKLEHRTSPDGWPRERIARGSCKWSDDGAPRAGDPVEKRRLPDIWPSNQHDGWCSTGHFRTSVSLCLDSVSASIYSSYKPLGDPKHDQGRHRQ